MSLKSQAYDHPAYTSVSCYASSATAAAGTTTKFVAFTNLIAKSVTLKPTTASAGSDVSSFIQISGTTTTTTAITTFGSGVVTFTNVPFGTQPILLQGDTFYVVKGTDTGSTIAASIETVVQPLANLTV